MVRLLTAVVVCSVASVPLASASSADRATYRADLRPVDDSATVPFRYEALTAGKQGTATARGKSTTFDSGTHSYYVNIHDPQSGSPIACGVLTPA